MAIFYRVLLLKNCRIIQHLRLKSSNVQGGKKKSKRYSNSLNLPQTIIPLTMKDGAASQRETEIQKMKGFQTLYEWQRNQNWSQDFVLHDGPPYANGKTHVGHVVNKVLKDITNRFKVMSKHKVHYVPGWDCHGMPIELKAITDKEGQLQALSPLEIRAKAKKFAEEVLEEQKEAFQSWGVMGDWNSPYKTLTPAYEARQLEIFHKIFEKGYVYRDYMPVYWSPSSRTALAEAELEYNPEHISKAVYVKFPVLALPKMLLDQVGHEGQVFALIWTTTSWTLPFNQAICYNPRIRYALLKDPTDKCFFLCEEAFVETLTSKLSKTVEIVSTFDGSCFENMEYRNPLNDAQLPFLPGKHVASEKGTGLVHTAPAHGHDDFAVALEHNLPKECHVDGEGRYTSGVVEALLGKTIGVDAETAVLELLAPWVVHQEDFTHSYPYDWRTKKPIIIRASKQWFIDTSVLRQKALECLSKVKIIPQQSERGMVIELSSRPYWCISRQRTWGVPIPVFYHKETDEPLINQEIVQHLCQLIKVHGSDCWWSLPVSDLLPDELLERLGLGQSSDYVKGNDILDIWFDSGVSWASVLNDYDGQADMYLEGIDQYKGWFQTSLLTSVAVQGYSPYRSIITHGFTTDENGKKMSKSVGNVVDPGDIIYGGKDRQTFPSYGVDVLRWWVAHFHHHSHIMIGSNIMRQRNEDVFKIRKCLRHMVGCLHDFDPQTNQVEYMDLTFVDKYILHLLYTLIQQILESYDSTNFSGVVLSIEKFFYSDLSSFYISSTRDRNYCDERDSVSRRSSQTAVYHMTKALTAAFAPIMPHLAQEFFSHTPGVLKKHSDYDSVFKCGFHEMQPEWSNPRVADMLVPVFEMRGDLMDEIGKSPIEFDVMIHSSPGLCRVLQEIQPERTSSSSSLCEIFQTSHVTVLEEEPRVIPEDAVIVSGTSRLPLQDDSHKSSEEVEYKIYVTPASLNICERCRKYTAETSKAPCDRCLEVLAADWIV